MEQITNVAAWISEIGEIESEIKMLEIQKQGLRDQLLAHMKSLGVTKVKADHIGTAMITADKKRVTYDAEKLDSLTAQLLRDGELHTANAIANLREEKVSNGYLMIKKEK